MSENNFHQEKKKNFKKITHALNTLLESDNLTKDEKNLVNDLFKASNATYEVENLDAEELGDVLAELNEMANSLKFLHIIEKGAIVSAECPLQFGDVVMYQSREAIEHYNEAMKGLSKYVKGLKYEPIRLE
ncbi:MAG TPA: hypothetical protein VMW09_03580 [Desulfatiglandales bacterium]|nr:hypothetical protein [Desulfatiglandales bacterium]